MSDFIELKDVSFSYDTDSTDRRYILKNFNLKIKEGDFVAVLGHNGSGKSTVAKLMNAIEKPISGKVFVDGLDTADDDNFYEIKNNVGMVFQNPDNQIVCTIVEDDVAFGPENLGIEPHEIRERVDDALKRVSMFEFKDFQPHKLSGGQKQRVAIAGIIAMKPKCIVFDEPTAMLDPKGRKEVMETVLMLNQKYGITIVYITHYMDEAIKANRVVVINNGEIFLDDTPKNVFKNAEKLKSVGLDVPKATLLSKELKNSGVKIRDDILTIDELENELFKLIKGGE